MKVLLESPLKKAVEELLEKKIGKSLEITGSISIMGGCIHSAFCVYTNLGDSFFLKSSRSTESCPQKIFSLEAKGLDELAKTKTLRIPSVLGYSDGDPAFILMEYLITGPKKSDLMQELGRGLADMHRKTKMQEFGFYTDNYIGLTPQKNDWTADWVSFFREKRLGFQVELAKKNGYWDTKLESYWEKLSNRLSDWIDPKEEIPTLLHGDLWSGNFLVGPKGEPCLIDPAVYYGVREADLSLTTLFGRFDEKFYSAYQESYPLEAGYEDRFEIYNLYHLLNHLNLFGSSYRSQTEATFKRFGT